MIRNVTSQDAAQIAAIYNYYIRETVITFEETPLSEEDIKKRIDTLLAKGYPYLVIEKDKQVIAFAYLNTWRARSAFDITLESSIYLSSDIQGKGIGEKLYRELIDQGRKLKLHSLVAAISLPNEISQKLHEKLGFKLVGNFREAGRKFGKLVDCEFWQLSL